jgi:hypothetical protein
MIWLGAHFETYTFAHTSGLPAGLWVLFWVHFGGALMPQKVHKSLQVGKMYVTMPKLESKPLTKSVGPILSER